MSKEKWLTVEELIKVLSQYEPKMRVIVTRDGNGHSYPIIKNKFFKPTTDCYFPYADGEQPEENETVLRIALI